MFSLTHTPGRTAIVDGKEYLFFSGYSYLGMNHVPEFVDLVKEGIDKYGWMFPSSRISNTQLGLFTEFEEKLSEITQTEETVCFSSGFLAGRTAVEILKKEKSDTICAPHTHPAICINRNIDESFTEWKKKLRLNGNAIAFDSVNPLTAEVNDVLFLQNFPQRFTCIIDDSHGAGLLNGGSGINKSLPKKDNINYIIPYSLSKAYNLVGGVVSCSADVAKQLRSSAYYTASTSISPAFAFAFINGQHLYQQQRERLQKNISIFRSLINNKFTSHPELPMFVFPENINEEKLEEAGIIISSFAYPDPSGEKIKRVVINALHTEDDLQRLAYALH